MDSHITKVTLQSKPGHFQGLCACGWKTDNTLDLKHVIQANWVHRTLKGKLS